MKLQIKDDAGRVTTISIANRNEVTVGRKEGNTVRLTERNVSRSHARFLKKGEEVHVEDLSRYGTRVNGERIGGARRVGDGDVVQIGDYELSFEGLKAFAPPSEDKGAAPPPPPKPLTEAELKKQKEIEAKAKAQIAQAKAESGLGSAKTEGTVSIQAMPDDGGERKSRGAGRKRIGAVHPTLVAVSTEMAGKEFPLNGKTFIVGRTGENDIVIDHHSISRNHAKIVIDGGGVKMVDLQSKNGIRVNGELWEESILKSGDVVELGKIQFRFVEKGEEFIYRPEDWAPGGAGQLADVVIDEPQKKGGKAWVFLLLLLLVGGGVAVYIITQKPPVADNVGARTVAPESTPPEAPPEIPEPPKDDPAAKAPEVDADAAVKDAIDKARSAVGAQNWEEALKHLEVVVVLDKGNEDARRLKETVLREQKIGAGYEAAQAAQSNKDLDGAWAVLSDLGVVPETSVYYSRVTELRNAVGPAIADSIVTDGRGYLNRKQYAEAIASAEGALDIVPGFEPAEDLLARAKRARAAEQRTEQPRPDRRPPAAAPPKPAAEAPSKTADQLLAEARSFHNTDPKKALSLYEQAAAKGAARAYKQIGSVKAKLGDRAGAVVAYERYLKLVPNASDAELVREILGQWKGQ